MTRPVTLIVWAIATVALSGLTTAVVSRWFDRGQAESSSDTDFHRWMHDHLGLSAEQHRALEPAEQAFDRERERLRGEIAAAGLELAEAVRTGERTSPEIPGALGRLHHAQGELQRATLDHFFAMKEQLDPEQAEKLLQWTHDSLVHQ